MSLTTMRLLARSVATALAFLVIVPAALGQTSGPVGSPTGGGSCFPPCRSGFVCAKGACVSRCNPACEEDETCDANGQCLDAKEAAAAARAAALAPPKASAAPVSKPPVVTPVTPKSSASPAPVLPAGPDGPGCMAARDQSAAFRKEAKLTAEREQLLVCAAKTCPAEVRRECDKRTAELADEIPTITLGAKDTAGGNLVAVRVSLDGVFLLDKLDGKATPVDPGDHVFRFEAAGLPALEKHFTLQAGEKDRHESVTLAPATLPVIVTTGGGTDRAEPQPKPSEGSTARTVGYIVGAVGIGAVVLGIYEQATALGRSTDSNTAAASSDPNVQATAKPIHDQAVQAQTYAIVSGVVGVGAIGTALYLILTAHPSKPAATAVQKASLRATPLLGPGVEGLVVEGLW
jgi:hypothetical protein